MRTAPEPMNSSYRDLERDGAAALIRRIGEFAGDEKLPAELRDRLQNVVNRYAPHLEAGDRLEASHKMEPPGKPGRLASSIGRRNTLA